MLRHGEQQHWVIKYVCSWAQKRRPPWVALAGSRMYARNYRVHLAARAEWLAAPGIWVMPSGQSLIAAAGIAAVFGKWTLSEVAIC